VVSDVTCGGGEIAACQSKESARYNYDEHIWRNREEKKTRGCHKLARKQNAFPPEPV